MEPSTYDFIVVGGGNAGAVVASRLASSPARPSVLLLEAGGSNHGFEGMSGAERYEVAFKEDSQANWRYKTTPQFGQQIDYSRGKGLGGSTAINFCGWVVGGKDDFDAIAKIVGDDAFGWANVQRCLKRVERLHQDVPEAFSQYIRPRLEDHGQHGLIDLSYQKQWRPSVAKLFEAARQNGWHVNPDINSGDPIGLGIGPTCVFKGSRVTAKSAYLKKCPSNLTVIIESLVASVIFDGDSAVGVKTIDGSKYRANKEVVISGGAINSPQLLLLSGIGSSSDLERLGIKVQKHLPRVGKDLQDHCFSTAGVVIRSKEQEPESRQTPSPMGFFKIDKVFESKEFRDLPTETQKLLSSPTVSSWEMATHTPFLDHERRSDNENVLSAIALIMNPQSRGTIALQSRNPRDPPLIDPKFLSHPFDRRVAIESLRELLQFLQAPALKELTLRNAGWPEEMTDEGLLAHFQQNLRSSWHMSGTVKMGRSENDSCVDSNFRVHGVKRLRVVDMSVVPLLPNRYLRCKSFTALAEGTHTQSTAYILAEIAADKIIAEHGLEQCSAVSRF